MVPEKYVLTRSAHEKAFEALKDEAVSRGVMADFPVSIIVGGQPGAAKANLISAIIRRHTGKFAVIGEDACRIRHPHFLSILREDDKNLIEYTEPCVRDWTSRLLKLAMDGSFDVILESDLRHPASVMAAARDLFGRGYHPHLAVIASKFEFSALAMHERYESQKTALGYGKWCAQERHDASYDNIPQTVSFLENNRFLRSISVHGGDGSAIYENRRDSSGGWVNRKISGSQTITDFGNRPLSGAEKESLKKSLAGLVAGKKRRGAPREEIELVRRAFKDIFGGS
jgi:hypothetical protein